MTALLIVGHGTRDTDGAADFRALVERVGRAFEQRIGKVVMEARLDDQKVRLPLRTDERFAVLGCASHKCLRGSPVT